MSDWQENYEIFFEVDEGYYPVINEDSIRDPKNRWEDTYPHSSVIQAMELLERIVSRSGNANKTGLWLEGSFGTGKSRLIWALQKLLDCSQKELNYFFKKYDSLKQRPDLLNDFKQLKKEKILTAYRYSSGSITNIEKFVSAIFDSVSESLAKAKLKYNGTRTLRGKIVEWLEADPANLQLFQAKISNPKYRGVGAFSGKTAEDILEVLKISQRAVDDLIENILILGEQEGIRAFRIDVDDLKAWLTEVIEENKLKAVVLFWDEFSDFFKHNKNALGEFQKLVELSNSTPFYLVIATHERESLASEDDKSFRTVSDRFVGVNIKMPDNIALELIKDALKVRPEAKNDWDVFKKTLAGRTEKSRRLVSEYVHVGEDILAGILPIHPMTALMLKNISYFFASNQRSMFNFIKNDIPDVAAFQHFIRTHNPHDGQLMMIDYLWSFFYEGGTDENTDLVGRSNLDRVIGAILDSYERYKDLLGKDEDKKSVLKAVLLMEAVTRKTEKERIKLLLPSEENLNLAFEGDDRLENGRAVSIAKSLVDMKILYKQPGKPETFATAAVSGDQEEIERIKKKVTENTRTSALVETAELMDAIDLSNAQRVRFKLTPVTVDNFIVTINKITNEYEDYHMRAAVCFARNEDEQTKMLEKIREVLPQERYHKLVFINASENLIGVEQFKLWVDYSANAEYWRSKDKKLSDQNNFNANDVLKNWKSRIAEGSFVVYPATKNPGDFRSPDGIHCQKASNLRDELKRNVLNFYPLSFDHYEGITEIFFASSNIPQGVKFGLSQQTGLAYNANSVSKLLGEVWKRESNYWETQPELSVSKLKILVDKFIDDQIKTNVRASLDEVFSLLMANGFMPCNLYALLTGFLMKEYTREPYHYSVGFAGDEGGSMTEEKLAAFLADAIKSTQTSVRNYREKFIEIMSPEHREFMSFAEEVFGVSKSLSVENGANKIRFRITDMGYPIWCYEEAADEKYKNFVRDLMRVANPKNQQNVAELTKNMGSFLMKDPSQVAEIKKIFVSEVGRKTLEKVLREMDDGIIFELAKKIGIPNVVIDVRRQISEGESSWLWDRETAEEEIRNLIVDYKIMAISREFDIAATAFGTCIDGWISRGRRIKVPCEYVAEFHPMIRNFLDILCEVVKRGELVHEKRVAFLAALENNRETIREALTDYRKVFDWKFQGKFSDWDEDGIARVLTEMPASSFTDAEEDYKRNLNARIELARRDHLSFKVKDVWKKISNSESPRDWSAIHGTPILILVPERDREKARRVFDTIHSQSASESDLSNAVEYLKRRGKSFKVLEDQKKIDEAFRQYIVGKNQILLKNLDEVRQRLLENKNTSDPYYWYANSAVQKVITKMAEEKYFSEASNELVSMISEMYEGEAKNYLLGLIESNYEVGIEILSKESPET